MTNDQNIIDVSEKNFAESVIELSSNKLVLVDFWAPWCGPCKQLTPLLEKIIKKAEGKVVLAKIDIDKNQQIASQLKIQSIPAVFAFKDKQIVDAFQGVIPENKIIEFIEKQLGEKLQTDNSLFYESIQIKFEDKEYEEAKLELEEFISKNSQDFKAISLYLNCLINLESFEEADLFVSSLDKETLANTNIISSLKKLEIKKKNKNGPTLDDLKNIYKKDPKNFKKIINLADKYFSENLFTDAFELLLENYLINKDGIKKKNLEFFEALGNDNKNTQIYRRKFSSIMFS